MAKQDRVYQIVQENDAEDNAFLQHFDEVNYKFYFSTYSGFAYNTGEKDTIDKIFQEVDKNYNGFKVKMIEFIFKGER